ncbi:MAG: DUF58 domain-containing protein [Woeseiaceae bacterium]
MSYFQQTVEFFSFTPFQRAIGTRVRHWAKRRQGKDKLITRLQSRRIYILPTTVGLVFALMVFTMLLGSMNYNNNLSFVLTFLLAGIGFVAMHQCQRNLVGLEIAFAGAEPVFAGQAAEFKIAITNHSKNRRPNLQLYVGGVTSALAELAPGESRIFKLEIPTAKRGRIHLNRFGIRTLFPFELFRSWAWLYMDLTGLVYPKPARSVPEPPPTQSAHGHRQHDARGEEDFAGLRRFHVGDSPRHVAWKAYARSGELLSKQFSGADTSSQWFDFAQVEAADKEQRLSILTRWIVDADRTQSDYGLRIPGIEFNPAHGDAHRHRCLETLAFFDNEDDDQQGENP